MRTIISIQNRIACLVDVEIRIGVVASNVTLHHNGPATHCETRMVTYKNVHDILKLFGPRY